ncbi:hypothetical protein ACQ858_14795 [Variovorax ureilyticus]|uniref:hypothetical protein n=1 Tax=Variovorax ureilyticus TaxID=1836198 RepID=UPI003D66EA5B
MTTLKITINTEAFNSLGGHDAPLLEHCGDQEFRALLLLDEDGACALETRAPWENGRPTEEWYGCTRTWALPANVRGDALHSLLTDEETVALLQRVHNGRSIDWNGNNHVGSLDDDAGDASDELEQKFEELRGDSGRCWSVWSVGDFLANCRLDEWWPAGRSLVQVAEAIPKEAHVEGILFSDGDEIETVLRDLLQRELDEDEEFEPTMEQRTALKG